MKKTCCWVMRAASRGTPAQYCGSPVAYHMARDDDNNRVREYHPFCPLHEMELKDHEGDEGDDDDDDDDDWSPHAHKPA